MRAKKFQWMRSLFSATFSLASLLSDHKVPNGLGTGAREGDTRVSVARPVLSPISRSATQAGGS